MAGIGSPRRRGSSWSIWTVLSIKKSESIKAINCEKHKQDRPPNHSAAHGLRYATPVRLGPVKRKSMSRYSISIGDKAFGSKSKALAFYKDMLNRYEVGRELNREDFKSIFDLVYMDFIKEEIKAYETEYNADYGGEKKDITDIVQQIREHIQDYGYETGDHIKSVIVDIHPEFRNTKCFFLMGGNGEKQLFSYLLAINGTITDDQRFSKACRHLVAERLHEFKRQRFKNRPVKCAVTNEIVEWEDCQIDHKAPLTFSVIVKSFIIAHKIDVSKVEYVCELTKEQFADQVIADKFDSFHKDMAVLRVLSTKQNSKLSCGARIKPTKTDFTLADNLGKENETLPLFEFTKN